MKYATLWTDALLKKVKILCVTLCSVLYMLHCVIYCTFQHCVVKYATLCTDALLRKVKILCARNVATDLPKPGWILSHRTEKSSFFPQTFLLDIFFFQFFSQELFAYHYVGLGGRSGGPANSDHYWTVLFCTGPDACPSDARSFVTVFSPL